LDRFVVALDDRDVGPSAQFMVVGAGDYLSPDSDVMSTALKRSVRKIRIGATWPARRGCEKGLEQIMVRPAEGL
jgi:hypothetical protein